MQPFRGTVRHPAVWMLCFAILLIGGSGAAPADELASQAAVRDFNAAAALQNVGLYDRAAEKWTAFIAQYPGDVRLDRANYYLGICQLHAKKYAEAINTFQTLLAKYPAFSNAEGAHYNLAMARYQAALDSKRREDFQAAAEALGGLAAKYPQGKYTAAALYYRGESLSAGGRCTPGDRSVPEGRQRFPHQFHRGRRLLRLGHQPAGAGPRRRRDRHLPEIPRHAGPGGPRVRRGSAAAAGAVAAEREEVRRGGTTFCRRGRDRRFPPRRPRHAPPGRVPAAIGQARRGRGAVRRVAQEVPQQRLQGGGAVGGRQGLLCGRQARRCPASARIRWPRRTTAESAEAACWLARALVKAGKARRRP